MRYIGLNTCPDMLCHLQNFKLLSLNYAKLHPIPKVQIPYNIVHVDVTGKLSNKTDRKEFVFVNIVAFVKYVLLHFEYFFYQ